MKKLLCLCVFLILSVSAFSQSNAIKKNKLPSKKEFKALYELFLENEYFTDHWTPNWDYEKSKETVAQELKEFDEYLSALKQNYEISLLSLIVKTYLYNIDEYSFDQIVEYGGSLKDNYPKEYRTWWIMGRFYSNSSPSYIYPEYETAVQMRGGVGKRDEWVIPFLWDYIYGCNMAGMRIHARQGLNYYCQYTGMAPEDYMLYSVIYSDESTASVDGTYDMYDTWLFDQTEEETRVYSSLLGVSIPVHGDWGMRANGYQDGKSFISFSSDPFPISDTAQTRVTFSIFAFTNVDKNYVDTLTINSATRDGGKIIKKKRTTINGIIADYYIYENLNLYNDVRNGMKGVTIVMAVPYTEFSGLSFERPIDYNNATASASTDDGMAYFRINQKLNRLETTIYFLISLDACNACFDEAQDWMNSILDGCIFE